MGTTSLEVKFGGCLTSNDDGNDEFKDCRARDTAPNASISSLRFLFWTIVSCKDDHHNGEGKENILELWEVASLLAQTIRVENVTEHSCRSLQRRWHCRELGPKWASSTTT